MGRQRGRRGFSQALAEDLGEAGLAGALLAVLQDYRFQGPPSRPATVQGSLAQTLQSVLQAAVRNSWNDCKVAERVTAKILAWKQKQQTWRV